MVSFRRTHYRISLRRFFARGAYRQEGPTGQRGLLVSGGGFGPGGLPLGYAPGRSNRYKEGTALNIHCIPMHLANSGLDLVNVYGSAPELKQSSRTWQQKEAKFLVFGL